MNLDLMRLVREGGFMMYVLPGVAGLAALGLLTLLAVRATGRKVPVAWLAVPAMSVWGVATLSTWQGLRVVRAAIAEAPEDLRSSMAAAGYSVAHSPMWLGWVLTAALFLCAALGMGMVALGTAGKGAKVQKLKLALMLLATMLMPVLTGMVCVYTGQPQTLLFAGGSAAGVACLGTLGLTLAVARRHPEDTERQMASAAAGVGVGLFAMLATVSTLLSFAVLGEIEAFDGLANASAEMQQMIVASGLGKHMQALTLARWLSGALIILTLLACRSFLKQALSSEAPLGRRTFMGLVVAYAILSFGFSNAKQQTMEEGLGYDVHDALAEQMTRMNNT